MRQSTTPNYREHLVTALRTIERLEHKFANSRAAWLDEPIAIVGMGCRFPGGADTPGRFWDLLRNGVDATAEFPAERADARTIYDEDPDTPGKAFTIRGAFLDRVDSFEPAAFGISPREALGMDPQHRIALEVAWEALERAGHAPDGLTGSKTGVFMGLSTTDYVRPRQQVGAIEDVDAFQLVGEPSFLAGRISYTLGLRGPSQVIDTACSSSLVALHHACQALQLGTCDMALAGGVNLILAPYGFVLLSKFGALSSDGRCKTFSAAADGYGRGEGAAIVVLRRLQDALADGDTVLAVVRGTAVNHDGQSSGLIVPNPAAQQEVVRAALAQARIDPAQVDYVEAHGTGTSLGDPLELRALDAVLGQGRSADEKLLVGSVKTNIGHLEAAAGVAGLAKLVLSLQHREIPPILHFAEPNPNVDWDRLRIDVADTRRAWPDRGRERIGGLSSFGASGTNAHAVVVSAPTPKEREPSRRTDGLFLASARTEEALRELAEEHVRHLRREPDLFLADVCYTSQVGRAQLGAGLAAVASSVDELADTLSAFAESRRAATLLTGVLPPRRRRRVAWLFTGQGSQYAGMGQGLLAEPVFTEAFERVAAFIDPELDRPLREVLWPSSGAESPINDTRYTQPALFALEYASAQLLQSWGLRPAALAGHSVGEITAACLAGVFSLSDAARLICARAGLMSGLPTGGVMVSLRCDEATAAAAIAPYPETLAIAAVNGPEGIVISGAPDDMAAVRARLKEQGVKGQQLVVSHAFHSPLMRPIVERFTAVLRTISYASPTIPLISNLTGELWTDEHVGPDYWLRHALGTVRFADGLAALGTEGFSTFLEIGPHPVLTALGTRCGPEDATFVPVLYRGRDDVRQLLQAVGKLHLNGSRVDWSAFHAAGSVRRVPLPTTPWHGDSYWFRQAEPAAGPAAVAVPDSDAPLIAGVRRRVRGAVPAYELDLSAEHWHTHSREDDAGDLFLPFGALAGTAIAVAEDCVGGRFTCVEEAVIIEPLPLDPDRTVQLIMMPADEGHVRCEYRSISPAEDEANAPWRTHLRGTLRRRVTTARLSETLRRPPTLDVAQFTRALRVERASLPGALEGVLEQARQGDDGVLVDLTGDGSWAEVLDAAAAASSWAVPDEGREGPAVIGTVEQVGGLACSAPEEVRYVRVSGRRIGTAERVGTVDFFAEDGAYLGGVEEMRVVSGRQGPARAVGWRDPAELLYEVQWQRLTDPDPPVSLSGEDILILADRQGFAARFAAELSARGAQVTVSEAQMRGLAEDFLSGPEAVRRPIGTWCAQAARPSRILVLTGLDAPQLDHTDVQGLEEYAAGADLLTVSVVQELISRTDCDQVRVTLVTRGAMPVLPEQRLHTATAQTLWGLGRVVALEHAERWGGSIDLDPEVTDAELGHLAEALTRTRSEDEQALRGAAVYVARLVARRPEAAELRGVPQVRPDGTYLITGGFGAIGLVLGQWLARAGAGRLVLLSRTPLPDRTTWDGELTASARTRVEAVRELERLGVAVSVVAADVADEAAMSSVFRDLDSGPLPLRGVIHAAGVSAPQVLRDVDAEEYRKVWRPKVVGGWLIHRLSRTFDLDIFVGFSSIAATWGSQHLASYSAGNAFLEGLAHHRRAAGLPALTVAWGPWELASDLFDEEVMKFLTATGLFPLSGPQALRLLGSLLSSGHTHQVVCAVDWSIYKPVLEARTDRPLLRTIQIADDRDGAAGSGDMVEALEAAGATGDRRELLTGFLRDAVADATGLRPDAVEPTAEVLGYGLDSLMVIGIVRRCKQALQLPIRASQLFERTTLADWADLLDAEFARIHENAGEGSAERAEQGDHADPTDPTWIRGDVTLDPRIRPKAGQLEVSGDWEHVLLTGATGFLGAFLLDELLRSTPATVHCLVRCQDEADGLRRIRENYQKYLEWPANAEARIAVVPGDLTEPLLGLSEARFGELSGLLDSIVHNGAWVNFSYTYSQLRAANLTGTEEILRLACRGRLTPVHYVSTYGIWGIPADDRTVIREDDDIAGAGKLVTGYVQTKWAAERLVELGRERGIPIDLYRPGRVLGHSTTGAALTTHFTVRVIKGCIQLGMVPELDLDIEMTPVDYVVSALVAIATGAHPPGRNYHLVNGHTMKFSQLAAELCGRWPVRMVPVQEWWAALRSGYGEQENELHPVMEVVEEFVVGGEEAIDYDLTNTEAALAGTRVLCPPLDERLLDTYLTWLTHTGYLPGNVRIRP